MTCAGYCDEGVCPGSVDTGLPPESWTRERLDPIWSGRSESAVMVRKFYPEEFKADAVELYSSTPGATIKKIVADLGVHEGTLSAWLRAAGVTTTPTAAGRADCCWRPSGRSCARQRSISRARRPGEQPFPVRR